MLSRSKGLGTIRAFFWGVDMLVRKSSGLISLLPALCCLLAFTASFAGSRRAAAQSPAAFGAPVSLSYHTAPQLLDGTATRIGPYAPQPMLRLVLAAQPPHRSEEAELLKELQTKDSPNFRRR